MTSTAIESRLHYAAKPERPPRVAQNLDGWWERIPTVTVTPEMEQAAARCLTRHGAADLAEMLGLEVGA